MKVKRALVSVSDKTGLAGFARNLAPGEISGILSISQRLLDTYIAIVYEHHPEIIAQNPYVEGPGP